MTAWKRSAKSCRLPSIKSTLREMCGQLVRIQPLSLLPFRLTPFPLPSFPVSPSVEAARFALGASLVTLSLHTFPVQNSEEYEMKYGFAFIVSLFLAVSAQAQALKPPKEAAIDRFLRYVKI